MKNKGYGIFFLRLFIGARLIYGVIDNVISWEKMLEFKTFLAANHFPIPLACAVVSVYAQLVCGVLFILGWKIRVAAFIMMFNFIIAVFLHLYRGDGFEAMTPALAIFFSSLLFFLEGPGKLSLKRKHRSL
jgi:putative oxidoreductase